MDTEQATQYLVNGAQADLQRRSRLLSDAELLGARAGAAANLLRDRYGISRAESARRLGLPPASLGDLMSRAGSTHTTVTDPLPLIPELRGHELRSYVAEHGPVERIVASFAESDVVYRTGIHLDHFPRDRTQLRVPNMLLRLQQLDDWVGVGSVSVGYLGSGPSNAEHALLQCNLNPDLAHAIAYQYRVSDVSITEDSPNWHIATTDYPLTPLGLPQAVGPRYIVRADASAGVTGPVPYQPGTSLYDWITFLDGPAPPDWANGLRRATVYTTRSAAADAGLGADPAPPEVAVLPRQTPQIIIEQGVVQLWVSALSSDDPTHWLPTEFHDVLTAANVFPGDIAAKDRQSALRKWISGHRNVRPSVIVINGGVTWAPSTDAI